MRCLGALPLRIHCWHQVSRPSQLGQLPRGHLLLDSGTQTSPAVVYFSLVALSLSQQTVAAPWDTLPSTATWGMVDVQNVTDITATIGVLVSCYYPRCYNQHIEGKVEGEVHSVARVFQQQQAQVADQA